MLSANSIALRGQKGVFLILLFLASNVLSVNAQDNSPYSRYGIGDLVPHSNVVNRAMGGVTAGYTSPLNINFNNPASLGRLQSPTDKLGKSVYGRAILDVGVNLENRTIRSPQRPDKFTSSYAGFSYLQIGMPLKKNWGMSFGLRPISRIGYLILRKERLKDPNTGLPIDSAHTEYSGEGGAFLPNISTGYRFGDLSIGGSMGYLFGNRRTSTRRALVNDTVHYYASNHTNKYSYGGFFFDFGAQYDIDISDKTTLRLGAAGNLKSKINGSEDVTRETFLRDATSGDFTLDSALNINDRDGEVIYPASYTFGFMLDHYRSQGGGWSAGAEFVQSKWDDYRFFGNKDAVKNNWQFRMGGELRPKPAMRSYFSNVAYRAGLTFGTDYITAGGDLSQWSASFGMALPLPTPASNRGQLSIVNLSLEYNKRGDNSNLLKENIFRVSAGFSLSDLWFYKRKYD